MSSDLADLDWKDMTDGMKVPTVLQFADRLSRIMFLTSLKYEPSEEEGDADVFFAFMKEHGLDEEKLVLISEMLKALSMVIGQTVESFGPPPKKEGDS